MSYCFGGHRSNSHNNTATITLSNEEQQQQEQLALDIINASGLVPVNETTVADGTVVWQIKK